MARKQLGFIFLNIAGLSLGLILIIFGWSITNNHSIIAAALIIIGIILLFIFSRIVYLDFLEIIEERKKSADKRIFYSLLVLVLLPFYLISFLIQFLPTKASLAFIEPNEKDPLLRKVTLKKSLILILIAVLISVVIGIYFYR